MPALNLVIYWKLYKNNYTQSVGKPIIRYLNRLHASVYLLFKFVNILEGILSKKKLIKMVGNYIILGIISNNSFKVKCKLILSLK